MILDPFYLVKVLPVKLLITTQVSPLDTPSGDGRDAVPEPSGLRLEVLPGIAHQPNARHFLRETVAGTRTLGPSGAPIWNSPTIDLLRNRLYVGTGENYSTPADGNSDAVIAFDLDSGEKLWVSQQTANDAWNMACLIEGVEDHSNCPAENGPDYDFGASVILVSLEDRDIIIGGQKSGNVMGIDPDTGALATAPSSRPRAESRSSRSISSTFFRSASHSSYSRIDSSMLAAHIDAATSPALLPPIPSATR